MRIKCGTGVTMMRTRCGTGDATMTKVITERQKQAKQKTKKRTKQKRPGDNANSTLLK